MILNVGEEVRVTDPETGGQKGDKIAQEGSLEPLSLLEVAKVAGYGAKKYSRFNYLNGYPWSLSYSALQRHLKAWYAGEDLDSEFGLSHLAHAAWHCLALLSFSLRGRGTDDRPTDANLEKWLAEARARAGTQCDHRQDVLPGLIQTHTASSSDAGHSRSGQE